jgi:6-phosphogluconolactonase
MTASSSSKSPDWLKIVPDLAALNRAAAEEFVRCAKTAIRDHGRFAVALSGGNTPRSVYALLAEEYNSSLPWDRVFVFFGDERHVPPDHPDSNYRMANEALLTQVPIPPANVYRIQAELEADTAAMKCEQVMREFFHLDKGQAPRFDLILLGMGEDGHTASLFPGTAALKETSRLVVANVVEKLQTERITFTLPVLNAAAEVLVMIAGGNKAEVLRNICRSSAPIYPIQLVQPANGRLLWIVEQHAAALV